MSTLFDPTPYGHVAERTTRLRKPKPLSTVRDPGWWIVAKLADHPHGEAHRLRLLGDTQVNADGGSITVCGIATRRLHELEPGTTATLCAECAAKTGAR